MAWLNNMRMAPKLIGSYVLVALLAGVVGGAGMLGLSTVNTKLDWITNNATPSLTYLLKAQRDANAAVRFTRGAVLSPDAAETNSQAEQADAARSAAWQDWQQYQALPYNNAHEAAVASQTQGFFHTWMPLDQEVGRLSRKNTAAGDAAAHRLSLSAERQAMQALTSGLDQLVAINQRAVATSSAQAKAAYSSAIAELVTVILIAVVSAIALGVLIARSIVRPLAEVKAAATSIATIGMANLESGITALARGDLTVAAHTETMPPTYRSRDEIGETAAVVRTIVSRAQAAIGSYEDARAQLQELIGQVARSSTQVDAGAGQLAQASEQVGQASGQIAKAIEEMARGAGDQSQSAAEASGQVSALSAAVTQVAASAEAQQHTAGTAAQTAQEGSLAVAQTIASIESVRAAVLKSAEQVHTLGQQSQEIGAIVAAIDDIAEQTNLLALNAAIEAARAGEHGKGFTVVAAEVRKLAERASGETKEITARIGAIQQQVAEVVTAMETGSSAVEQSVAVGAQARASLESILAMVEQTSTQAQAIAGAVTAMQAGTEQVSTAIDSIAAVSEQSAAGAEEVSASTEEQSASVQEMAAGAQELAALAAGLQEVVDRFVLEPTPAQASDASTVRSLRAA